MSFDSLFNAGEYLSAHYLAEVLPKDLRRGRLPDWTKQEKAGHGSPRSRLRVLRKDFFAARAAVDARTAANGTSRDELDALHDRLLEALGFTVNRKSITIEHSGEEHAVPVLHAERDVVGIECGWATDVDTALDPAGAGRLPAPVDLSSNRQLRTGTEMASYLFGAEEPPRYVLILAGAIVVLADRYSWGEGRYLAVNLDSALGRNDTSPAGELDTIAALFSAEALHMPAEGGANPLAALVNASHKHAVGVSGELRTGLRRSVELIANEVLDRIRAANVDPGSIDEPRELARKLTEQSLRYLYRILFLLYAEARPELAILPADYPEYAEGYGMARLGELVTHPLLDEDTGRGLHLYESLALLFELVNDGYRTRAGTENGARSEDEGIRFENLNSDLFNADRTSLIGSIQHPEYDPDSPNGTPEYIDTRLRNSCLHPVLRLLMLSKGRRKERGGFISYAQLGINQLGAVYEGLMSYTGFIADEELYEVAKNGDASGGSWMIPARRAGQYPDDVFVEREDEETGNKVRVRYPAGSFVYRLAGRDRQTSASYYTPESLTKVTVQLTLEQRITEAGGEVPARELLDWTICEPALGSGAFLNEAINQIAAEYLRRRQKELSQDIPPEEYETELRKVKAYIALHNSYGVDLNPTAVELAEVSIWLNVMHPGLQAPWFGLHLRRGNSLIGACRRYYTAEQVAEAGWARDKDTVPPTALPLRDGKLPDGAVHHYLLPAIGWAAVTSEKEAKELAPEDTARLAAWRRAMRRKPTKGKAKQIERLQALARRAEFLWGLVIRRMQISQQEISRHIDVWGVGVDELRRPLEVVPRQKVFDDLYTEGTPYWRLKTLMDTWCALWFWPVRHAPLLDGNAPEYSTAQAIAQHSATIEGRLTAAPVSDPGTPAQRALPGMPTRAEQASIFEEFDSVEIVSRQRMAATQRKKPQRRPAIALSALDDWLDFAESLLGTHDLEDRTLFSEITRLSELDELESSLPAFMNMEEPVRIVDRYPWFTITAQIADQQGFFHWELDFAHIFSGQSGGFDLQLGNPPWVRPTWDESSVLAERDPWFKLAPSPTPSDWDDRKRKRLDELSTACFFVDELTNQAAVAGFLGSSVTYELLAGSQPDLYRAFMVRAWANLGPTGAVGLIHPDTHFTGTKEGRLRAATYCHLRIHAHFQNRRLIFPEVDWNKQFGLHIYGNRQKISFIHVSWLYDTAPLIASRAHDGNGEVPGMKHRGDWDLRPHRQRLVEVNDDVLAEWRLLSGDPNVDLSCTKLLYPVTIAENGAITALACAAHRLASRGPQISSGFHEANARKAGLIRGEVGDPGRWEEVVLRGPQFSVATPIAKQPPNTSHVDKPLDLTTLASNAVPTTGYRRASDLDRFREAQDRWVDHRLWQELLDTPEAVSEARQRLADIHKTRAEAIDAEAVKLCLRQKAMRRYTEFYRIVWREMVPASTERSLFPAIVPPGPTHVHAVRTAVLPTNRETALTAGYWSALPVDYLLRITGRGHLDAADARAMPAPRADHPLAGALLLRTLRLNCLTDAYSDLWAELYDESWCNDQWAAHWPNLPALGLAGPVWERSTPLRTERARRSALVELDALVALMLGIDASELVALYLSRFPQLVDYENEMWFDANGRKLAANFNQWGHGQTKAHYQQLMAHLDDGAPPPEGYETPFHKANRVEEMRVAHETFSTRLVQAQEGGTP